MTNGIEEMLREGFNRLTADAKAPAGMVGRAQRHNRRRRNASLSAAAAGTAVAAAAVITAVAFVPQGNPAPGVQTVAYVTSRAQQALAAVAQARAIEEVQATARNGTFGFTVINMAVSRQQPPPPGSAALPGVLGSVKAERMTSWFYHGLMLNEGFSAAGKLVFAASIGPITSPTGKQVAGAYGAAYPARTRWLSPLTGPNGSLPKLTCANAFPGAATPHLRAIIRKALSCKLFALAGHQRIGGIDAIKLIMKPLPGLPIRETLWLNPSTYLPLRASVAFRGSHGQVSLLVQDYRWLPPTAANLAGLHAAIHDATIPSRFRMLSPADLPLAGFDTPPVSQP
jgi:hypothetical protein